MNFPSRQDDRSKARSSNNRPTVRGWLADSFARLLPHSVRSRALDIGVYAPEKVPQGEGCRIKIVFQNRLPIPLRLTTGFRPWYWAIDGVHDADAAEPDPDGELLTEENQLYFGSLEQRTISRYWSGRVRNTPEGKHQYLEMGQHSLTVEITAREGQRPSDTHTFDIT